MVLEQQRLCTACFDDAEQALDEAEALRSQIEALASQRRRSFGPFMRRGALVRGISARRKALLEKARLQTVAAKNHKRAIKWLEKDATRTLSGDSV